MGYLPYVNKFVRIIYFEQQMKKINFLIIPWVLLLPFTTLGQEQGNNKKKTPNFFLGLNGEYGYVLPTSDFFRGSNNTGNPITQVTGGSIEAGWRARGANEIYDPILNYPAYGFGFLTYGFPQTTELGYPNAFYMFLNAPFHRWGRFSLNYIIRLGMSYNWEPNDPVDNVSNLVIGSYRNLYISFGAEAEYRLSPRWDAALGFAFSHFSNGKSSLPNSGANLLTPHLKLAYNFNQGVDPDFVKTPKPEYTEKGMEYYFTFGNGVQQVVFDSAQTGVGSKLGVTYPIYNISLGAQYQYGWSGKFGGGVDLIYWGPYDPQIYLDQASGIVKAVEYPFADHFQVGVFISYEFVLNNVSIYAQPGWRIIRKKYDNMPPDFYQHLAIKYHVHDLIIGMAIRAIYFGQAEYIEWNIGYRFKTRKKG